MLDGGVNHIAISRGIGQLSNATGIHLACHLGGQGLSGTATTESGIRGVSCNGAIMT